MSSALLSAQLSKCYLGHSLYAQGKITSSVLWERPFHATQCPRHELLCASKFTFTPASRHKRVVLPVPVQQPPESAKIEVADFPETSKKRAAIQEPKPCTDPLNCPLGTLNNLASFKCRWILASS